MYSLSVVTFLAHSATILFAAVVEQFILGSGINFTFRAFVVVWRIADMVRECAEGTV